MSGAAGAAPGALEGLRVVDLSTYLPGPYASMMLADLGADVTVIEPPGGEPGRFVEPRIGTDSSLHWWVARNKRSVVLNLKQPADREHFGRLVAKADVVLEGFTPGVATRLGVDYAACRAWREDIIYCAISSYGSTGTAVDVPSHDINIAARAGLLDQVRDAAGSPVPIGPPLVDVASGMHATIGVLAALRHRDRTGEGQFIDVSMLSSALSLIGPPLAKALSDAPVPRDQDFNLGADPAYAVYRTGDGRYLSIGSLEDKFWHRLCAVLGREDLVTLRYERPDHVRDELAAVFASADLSRWNEVLSPAGVCFAPVNTVAEVPDDPFVMEAGDITVQVSVAGKPHRQIRNPLRMSGTPPRLRRPAPELPEAAS